MRLSTRRLLLTDEERAPEVSIPLLGERGGWSGVFPKEQPLAVEIGLGKDPHILVQAEACPDMNFIGLEYSRKKLDKVLAKISHRGGIPNLRVVHADATRVFSVIFPPESLELIYIFFPDPWPKKRHHGRRIIRRDFIPVISQTLRPGSPLEIRTDSEEYVEQMVEVLSAEPTLENTVAPAPHLADPLERDSHISTLFEAKFRLRGLPIYYFYYRKSR